MARTLKRSATIIELVMAIVILSIAMPPLMIAYTESSMQSLRPSRSAIAAYLASERMEEIIARRYRGTDGYSAVTTTNFPNESSVTNFTSFARAVTVTYTNSSLATVGSDQGYKKVRVTVSWSSGARSVALERVFASF